MRKRVWTAMGIQALWLAGLTAAMGAGAPVEWDDCLRQDDSWYASAEAARVAENVMLYQLGSGGWPKNTDMARPLSGEDRARLADRKDQREESTIDNGATVTPMRFLARVHGAAGDERCADAFLRGLDFLLDIQYPNGGWPQFPHKRGYYQHITFNDNAMVNVMNLLRDVLDEPRYAFVDGARRQRAAAALEKGLECILRCQIIVDGVKTAWCAQHDERTLKPAPARSYEKISLSGSESVGIVRYLMGLDNPPPAAVEAVQAAVAWFDRAKIEGIREERVPAPDLPRGYDKIVVEDPSAPPLWARFYEIGTNRPIYCGRDGVIKYHLSEIEHERRVGYGWHTRAPARILEDYPAWQARWAPQRNVLENRG